MWQQVCQDIPISHECLLKMYRTICALQEQQSRDFYQNVLLEPANCRKILRKMKM